MSTAIYIRELFPEIALIQDVRLQELVVTCYLRAMERGGWTAIHQLPYIDSNAVTALPVNFVTHVRSVTLCCKAVAEILARFHGYEIAMDILLAGALLHDVGLLLEFVVAENGQPRRRYPEASIRHPFLGMTLILESGGPMALAHLVASHSFEGDRVERSIESWINHRCDFLEYDIARRVDRMKERGDSM